MIGQRHQILGRDKESSIMPAELSQFTLSVGESVECDFLSHDMAWSLLCFDAESRQAAFVRLPDDIDLSQSPFAFITQFENAQEMLLVSFDDLPALTQNAPCPDNIVMVYSIGRCGSTLVSKIFAQVPGVWSVSEPDTFSNLVGLFADNKKRFAPADVPTLIRAATRLAYRPTQTTANHTLVIKHRSQLSYYLDEMAEATTGMVNLYIHREAVGWANSFFQFAQKQGFPSENPDPETLRFFWDILTCQSDISELTDFLGTADFPTTFEDIYAGCWHSNLGQFTAANELGMNFHPFSYDQLNNDREQTVIRLLDACKISPEHVDRAMKAYDGHSQKGTIGAPDETTTQFSPQQRARVAELVANGTRPEVLYH